MAEGRIAGFVCLILITFALFESIRRVKAGMDYPLRRLEALNAIDEAIGTATELGRPIFFSTGDGDVVHAEGMQVLAGLDVLAYTSSKCAEYNSKIIAATSKANVHAITEEVVRQAFSVAGHPESYQPEMVQFLSDQQMAYCAAGLDMMRKEKIAAAMLIGPFFRPGLILADGASEMGAITIAGTGRMSQLPLFVASCDYVLIGEEMYAGSAYLTGDKTAIGTIAGQDVSKVLAVTLIVAGAILQTFGVPVLANLLKR